MQNKGIIRFFAIALVIVCLYQLSFTFVARKVEGDATAYSQSERYVNLAREISQGNELLFGFLRDSISKSRERFYLDSIMNLTVYNLGFASYTFQQVKERELNLGLDLKGGMNVTLEVSVPEILRVLSDYNSDPLFLQSLERAREMQRVSRENFVTLFGRAFEEIDPNASLAAIFSTVELRDRVNFNSTNEEVLHVLRAEVDGAISRSFQILRTRIDRFGVAQPNIQMLEGTGRILVELPGIKEPERVRRLLQGTARLEFWETYEFSEVYQYFVETNERLRVADTSAETIADESSPTSQTPEVEAVPEELLVQADTAETPELVDIIAPDITAVADEEQQFIRENPLFAVLTPAFVQDQAGQLVPGQGPVVGYSAIKDTARVNTLLRQAHERGLIPRNLQLIWNIKPLRDNPNLHELIAIRQTTRDGAAPLTGEVIVDARQDYDPVTGEVVIDMSMSSEGARTWRRLTADNIGRAIAIVLDGFAYSFPIVQSEIPGGRSQITGQFTVGEAQDMANILEAGSMPAPVRIVEEAIVGPSLGREAVNSGLTSFIIAFVMVLIYMAIYYSRAGLVANIALVSNVFFIMGVLASLGATLTLPGIAGIVLTLGMAVDANVIVYERVLEELRAGKGQRLAIADGFKNAYSAIIDANVTTLLTGIVLNIFGSGPVQGFATTLIIGIISSLFTAVFLSRLIFSRWIDKNTAINFDTKLSKDFLTKINFDFIGVRKKFYLVSVIIIGLGISSLFLRGFTMGVDFSGGRSYVVRFDQEVNTAHIRESLEDQLGEAPIVKTFGPPTQIKITTTYLIEDETLQADSLAERRVFDAVAGFYNNPITFSEFTSDDEAKVIGRLSSQKVGPTVARDIKINAVIAVIVALLIIFIYIAVRFKKWQFGVGGLTSLAHDTLIVVSLYSLLPGIVPWSMEIDQTFIAAILTIIGYSINDTVVIFDRVRENINLFPKRELKNNVNLALNATLSRTFNTSVTTLAVLMIIFLFGGEVIRGFAFAMMVGIGVGTYSSLFNAVPVAYDLILRKNKDVKAG
ncbi:MAG TPA: protein translocase subunit SecDF [Bacteroidales bacterium]|nr:protein translocase subunit SecDF [Bacteroidales bacterium]